MKASLTLCLLAATAMATPVLAAPNVSEVRVTIGPELFRKTKTMDQREFDYLTKGLKRSVERRLERSGALSPDGGHLDLVIEDARPNRPTFRELGSRPGLSIESFGVGGAKISGQYLSRSGERIPVDYSWYETDIRQARNGWTWSDADYAFDRFAARLQKGQYVER